MLQVMDLLNLGKFQMAHLILKILLISSPLSHSMLNPGIPGLSTGVWLD